MDAPDAKVTVRTFLARKVAGEKIVMLTAYDYTTARLLDEAGVDAILVGDSLSGVVQGHETTLPVTMDEMVYHTACVARGTRRAMVIGDMPFMSYQASEDEAIKNAGRFLKEGGAQAVKLEGGERVAGLVARLVSAGIPVMGHIGLTPQSVHQLGGYRLTGKAREEAERLVRDAHALEQAGAFAIVLEMVPAELAARITSELSIPTIGIGAGSGCDGQVLVVNDMLGLTEVRYRFVKQYANLAADIRDAVARYAEEVRSGVFPGPEHSFTLGAAAQPEKKEVS